MPEIVTRGRGVLPYISYIGMCRVKGYGLFWSENGYRFDHYGLKSGMVFKGTTRAYKHFCHFNSRSVSICNREIRQVAKIYHSSWILPILDFGTDAKLNYATTKPVGKFGTDRARSENGCRKWHILVWNRVRIWRTRRHTPTKNSEECPPPPPGNCYMTITCSIFNQCFWDFHNQRSLKKSAHWKHKIMAPSYMTWFTTPATSGTFCPCTFFIKVISDNNQCSESCNLRYSLVVYPIQYVRGKWEISIFVIFTLDTTSSTPVGAIYSIPQKFTYVQKCT